MGLKKNLLILLAFNLFVYIPVIFIHDYFYKDDFLIFALISKNPQQPVAFNIHEYFYFFLRPAAYMSFWLDYSIWSVNSVGIKFTTLILHLSLISFFVLLIYEIALFWRRSLKAGSVILGALFLSFHPDTLKWFTWIANRTELLMVLFYSISLWAFLKYLNSKTESLKYIILSLLFYLASICSKQQSLHLPMLILVLTFFFRDKIEKKRQARIYITFSAGFLLMLVYSFLNAVIYQSQLDTVWGVMWKKPFAALGNLLLIICPGPGEDLYYYFIIHKMQAGLLLLILVLFFTFYFLKKNRNIVPFLKVVFIVLIIFYPRLLAGGGVRLNTIQILWFSIALAFMPDYRWKILRVLYPLISMILLINLFSFFSYFRQEISSAELQIKKISELDNLYNDRTIIVLADEPVFTMKYQKYFERNKKFGEDSLTSLPFSYMDFTHRSEYSHSTKVRCSLNGDELTMESLSSEVFLSADPVQMQIQSIENISSEASSIGRDYKIIKVKLNKAQIKRKLVYFDGSSWQTIS